ncbi:MAG: hypothetical protein VB130_08645 [Clostridium sp.]|nr:hypothetical protein [Clostridium sp.]
MKVNEIFNILLIILILITIVLMIYNIYLTYNKKVKVRYLCKIYNKNFSFIGQDINTENEEKFVEQLYEILKKSASNITIHKNNLIRYKRNEILKVDYSNYIFIIITLLITFFSTYYSHILSKDVSFLLNDYNLIQQKDKEISGTIDQQKKEKLFNERIKMSKEFNKSLSVYTENISPNNPLFRMTLYLILVILIYSFSTFISNWMTTNKESLYRLYFDILEDLKEEQWNNTTKGKNNFSQVEETMNQAIKDADNTIKKAYESLEKVNRNVKFLEYTTISGNKK